MGLIDKVINIKQTPKQSDIERQYQTLPSISDYLPWLEWSDEKDIVLLEDARSVGALFELKALPSEARPDAQINELHNSLVKLLSNLLPSEDINPWVMQIYVQDDLTFKPLYQALEDYVAQNNDLNDPLAQKYLSIMQEHFNYMCHSEGFFKDPLSNIPFRGKIRRVRVALYRRYEDIKKQNIPNVVEELDHVCDKFTTQMQQIGIPIKRLKGEHFYDWLVRWFNPNPRSTDGDIDELIKRHPYPGQNKPFGWSFTQNVFHGPVQSDDDGWWFDDVKHKVLTFKDLDNPVSIGALTREMSLGEDQKYAMLDKFPPGTVYTIQITFESKQAVNAHLDKLEKAARGKSGVVTDILNNINRARYELDNGHLLFRSTEALYIQAKTDEELKKQELQLQALLDTVHLSIIDSRQELFPTDLYLRYLPFNFSYSFDKKHTFRSSYKYADDVARLLPLYGRSCGDGLNPLNIFYNRGGEVFMFDHLSKDFKMSNSHMAIVGTTGAGKSVTLNNMCLSLSAVHNPRIVAMEVGGSFDLSAKYLAAHGRNVKTFKFNRQKPIAVNPYAEAYKALEVIEKEEAAVARHNQKAGYYQDEELIEEAVSTQHSEHLLEEIDQAKSSASDEEMEAQEDRDILNEMVLATRVMITHGSPKEEEKIDPTDLSLITRSIVHAMKRCKAEDIEQMILSHVIESMYQLAEEQKTPQLKERLTDFALRLEFYTHGIRGQFINRPSEPLQDFDMMHIDFGFMQEESYKDLLNITCIALLGKILSLAETHSSTQRPTELFMDEAHVLFKSDMVSAFVILMAKVARKIGLWLKPCTQNIEDFTGIESKKVLSMMETWLCLALQADEVALIEQFKPLSDEMRSLILDVKKYPGLYAEGVLLGKRYMGLFRNVPPRIALSLAMTEQDEKAKRRQIQKEHNMSELEAVEYIAQQMLDQPQKERSDDDQFFY